MRAAAVLVLLVAAAAPAQDAPAKSPAVGLWEGKLAAGPINLRLRFTVTADAAGKLSAVMVSPDQSPAPVPAESAAVTDGKLTLDFPRIGAKYTATLRDENRAAEGVWQQSGVKFPLSLKKVEKPTEAARPQTPKPPYPYDVEDVTFPSAAAGVTLAGTLTSPRGVKNFPAAVLVSGSGPQDRDETLFEHKPFAVLADHLARRGVAVLRYDDRGVGRSTGSFAGATSEDFAKDAAAAVAFLAKRPGVDTTRIGVVGHSEGGLIAPMVAAENPGAVGFVVLLAGPGVPGAQILRSQTDALLAAAGGGADLRNDSGALIDALLKAAAKDGTRDEIRANLAAAADECLAKLPPERGKQLGWSDPGTRKLGLAVWSDPWQRYFLRSDPRPNLAKLACPVLALNGELDIQVKASDNLAGIKAACPAAETRSLPGLNHLFQPAKTGTVAEYAEIETTFDAAALAAISDWVTRVPPRKAP